MGDGRWEGANPTPMVAAISEATTPAPWLKLRSAGTDQPTRVRSEARLAAATNRHSVALGVRGAGACWARWAYLWSGDGGPKKRMRDLREGSRL